MPAVKTLLSMQLSIGARTSKKILDRNKTTCVSSLHSNVTFSTMFVLAIENKRKLRYTQCRL